MSEEPASTEEQQEPKAKRRGIYLLPNLFTTAGMFAGFYAVVAAIDGRFVPAAAAIFIAMIWDGLDGRVARGHVALRLLVRPGLLGGVALLQPRQLGGQRLQGGPCLPADEHQRERHDGGHDASSGGAAAATVVDSARERGRRSSDGSSRPSSARSSAAGTGRTSSAPVETSSVARPKTWASEVVSSTTATR